MAFTQADIDAIDEAIKNQVLTVSDGDGGSVTYRSTGDMIKARDKMVRSINSAKAKASGGSSMYSVADFT